MLTILTILSTVTTAAIFGQTKFSHMTSEEFSRSHGLRSPGGYYRRRIPPIFSEEEVRIATETAIDWREKGVVLPIKNQALCGSCWAFSAISTIESQLAIKTGGLESLSEEEAVDCVQKDDGCMGGWPDDVFDWVQNYGITAESLYNYTAGSGYSGKCLNASYCPITKITKHIDLPNNEGQMLAYVVANGPISITVDATRFQSYQSGIVENCISNRVDHAVNIVGYQPSTSNYSAYWIVRNSWDTDWGEGGYIRIKYGDDLCMITSNPSAVVI